MRGVLAAVPKLLRGGRFYREDVRSMRRILDPLYYEIPEHEWVDNGEPWQKWYRHDRMSRDAIKRQRLKRCPSEFMSYESFSNRTLRMVFETDREEGWDAGYKVSDAIVQPPGWLRKHKDG
eukprot:Hpha_TRINITY_DN27863_c0_g1::TRINITY_DN27863_c0_g1_i1::g.194005::m.194005